MVSLYMSYKDGDDWGMVVQMALFYPLCRWPNVWLTALYIMDATSLKTVPVATGVESLYKH